MTKRVLILGGTGRTGKYVVNTALAAGMLVNILARRPEAVTQVHENLTVFDGTPENASDIAPAIEGCDAVVATLNNARAKDSPFAKIINSPTLLTDCYANIIWAMKENKVRRIVHLGAFGANESFAAAPWIFKQLIKRSNLSVAYRDQEGVEDALEKSGLDWTVARAAGLGAKAGTVIESHVVNGKTSPKPAMMIGRQTVAAWMVDALDRVDLHKKAVIISAK